MREGVVAGVIVFTVMIRCLLQGCESERSLSDTVIACPFLV